MKDKMIATIFDREAGTTSISMEIRETEKKHTEERNMRFMWGRKSRFK